MVRSREERLAYASSYAKRNRDYINKRTKLYYELNPAKALHTIAKKRAVKYGIPFDLLIDDILIPEECPILHTPFSKGTRAAMSLDRINNSTGYIKGNIQVISRKANTMKSDANRIELLNFADWIYKNV